MKNPLTTTKEKQKPVIRWDTTVKLFTINGVFQPSEKARELWDAGTGDWTQGAYEEMARMVLS